MDTKDKTGVSIEDRPEQPLDGSVETPSCSTESVTPSFTVEQLRAMTIEDLKPFLKDARGQWRTANLFKETCEDPAKYPPIYTLEDDDTSSCVSIKRLYFILEDITEFKIASLCFGGWAHWKAVTESFRVKPYIEQWRRDLDMLLRYKYLENIKSVADSGEGPVSLQANKYLLETTTGIKAPARGRPSKVEKEAAIQKELRDSEDVKRDMERLGIKVVN